MLNVKRASISSLCSSKILFYLFDYKPLFNFLYQSLIFKWATEYFMHREKRFISRQLSPLFVMKEKLYVFSDRGNYTSCENCISGSRKFFVMQNEKRKKLYYLNIIK